jgi:FMN phosphatase YigB (HAD superfamily)
MIHYVFDLDDTLIIHKKGVPIIYDRIQPDMELNNLLEKCNSSCYISPNGTGGHALDVIERMNIKDKFEKIYSRDTIPHMKPLYKSFTSVHEDLSSRDPLPKIVFFFDDLLENLETASKMGWITFWIHPNYQTGKHYSYVRMSFPNIKACLRYLETKYRVI